MANMNLVIVESAAKAKTIEKYLQSIPELKGRGTFKVLASLGHVRDLPSKEMGVDTQDWTVAYEVIGKKRDVLSKLKAAAKEADKVYLASDPDREGAAIAYHLREVLHLKRPRYERVAFHEITKKGIREAFLNPSDIDMPEVEAQEARRILDRVVGYELSPLLWRRFATSSLSAGRVQSAALHLLVRRSKEVTDHTPERFWTCEAIFFSSSKGSEGSLSARAYHQGKVVTWEAQEDITAALEQFAAVKRWEAMFSQKTVKRAPPPPFVTSSLQQEAYQRHSIPAKRTMQLAQALYEAGHITYMRTDSTTLSQDAQESLLAWVQAHYGSDMTCPRQYATKNAHAQEAHECIRPTHVEVRGQDLAGEQITPAHRKLYEMIWRRTVASQMAPAEYAQISYEIAHPKWDPKKDMVFYGASKLLVHPGFLKLYQPVADDHDDDENVATNSNTDWIRKYLEGKEKAPMALDNLCGKADATRPPPLYHEPSLVKTLEKEGIGRPSTYATILDKLQDKGYVCKGNVPIAPVNVTHVRWSCEAPDLRFEDDTVCMGTKDSDRLIPTSLGTRVTDYLQTVVPFLLDTGFTAEMETDLDRICHREKNKKDVLTTFYHRFHTAVEDAKGVCADKQKEGATSTKREAKDLPGPSKVLKAFHAADVVQTRYGPALYVRAEKRFVSLTPFLEWRSKAMEDMSEQDAEFLASFPRKWDGTTREIAWGPYGMYVKDGSSNIPMPNRDMWNAVYDGTLVGQELDSLQKGYSSYKKKDTAPKKKVTFKKKAS